MLTIFVVALVVAILLLVRFERTRVIWGELPSGGMVLTILPAVRIGWLERCLGCGRKNLEAVALTECPTTSDGGRLDHVGLRCNSCGHLHSSVTRWGVGNLTMDVCDGSGVS
ncbi:MAG: hypothetical protein V1685_01370 [Parcubacteria group bacterium]